MIKGKKSNKEYKEVVYENRIIHKVEETADIFNRYFVDSIRMLSSKDQREDNIENKRYTNSVW